MTLVNKLEPTAAARLCRCILTSPGMWTGRCVVGSVDDMLIEATRSDRRTVIVSKRRPGAIRGRRKQAFTFRIK